MLPPRRTTEEATVTSRGYPVGGLEPIGAPMSVSGLGPRTTQFLADTTGLLPVRGGGSMAAPAGEGDAS